MPVSKRLGRGLSGFLAGVACLAASMPARADDAARFLGAIILPNDAMFAGTTIGGLSGITYDANDDSWFFISDDKSEHGPARYYAADIRLDSGRLESVRFKAMTPLKQADGKPYTAKEAKTADGYVDPEAIAYTGRGLIWTSEASYAPFVQNRITSATMDGEVLRRYELPEMLAMDEKHTKGSRDNNGLEALTVTPGGGALWLGMEEPLIQDGDLPDETRGATVRITKLDRDRGTVLGQYAYQLEKRAHAALPGKHADGPGLSELAAIDGTHALALERSWVEGVTNYGEVFLVDLSGATDVADMESLKGATFKPVTKKLVLDLNAVGIQMDNYEGMALGPTLADGRRLLVICTDNNFNSHEKTIVAAFALDMKALDLR